MPDETQTTEKQETRSTVIDKALETANAEAAAEAEKSNKDEHTTTTEKDKTEDKGKNKEEKKVDEDAILREQGRDLLLALRDPAKAPIILEFFAKQAGYSKPPETKTEVKEVKEDILSLLKESMGGEFDFLAEKIAPALDKYFKVQLEKANTDIRKHIEQQEADRYRSQASNALTKLGEDFFGKDTEIPDNVTNEMSKLMDRIPPNGDSVKDYLEDIFYAAVGRLGLTKVNKSKQERINNNRNDAAAHLASSRSPSETGMRTEAKKMSREDAIRAALEAVDKEQ